MSDALLELECMYALAKQSLQSNKQNENIKNKIIEIYNSDDFNLEYKLDDSPLTIADTASNKIIENILEASNIPILSEGKNTKKLDSLGKAITQMSYQDFLERK